MNSHTPLSLTVTATLAEVIDLLNRSRLTRTIIVVDRHGKVRGTLTDGDIRRWLRPVGKDGKPMAPVQLSKVTAGQIMNKKPIIVRPNDSLFKKVTEARRIAAKDHCEIRLLPVVDASERLIDVLDLNSSKQRTRLEVILMAKAKLAGLGPATYAGRYEPCLTHEAFRDRRQRYDTTRYAYEREKYAALGEIIKSDLEVAAILEDRRLDELYMALNRGEEWAKSCKPPSDLLRRKLETLSVELGRAKISLVANYAKEAQKATHIGPAGAANRPDVVFILGCLSESCRQSRVDACATFLQTLKDSDWPKTIVLSGAGTDANSTEAFTMRKMLIGAIRERRLLRAIKTERISVLQEEDSLDTVGNAVFGQLMLIGEGRYSPKTPKGDRGNVKICVFTSDFHARRTMGLFQRVFYNAEVAVRSVAVEGDVAKLSQQAAKQLESEALANTQTFSLPHPATGVPTSITDGHVQSVFFQLMRHHKSYQNRTDLIRKYAEVLNRMSNQRSN